MKLVNRSFLAHPFHANLDRCIDMMSSEARKTTALATSSES